MQVYKFGGASVKDAAAVKNVTSILKENNFNEKVVVISAMGKSTNELENVINLYYAGNGEWEKALGDLFDKHVTIINELYGCNNKTKAVEDVKKLIEAGRKFLKENASRNYNYIYDQIVSIGEYISTTIVSDYANSIGLKNTLLDVKEVLFTDNAYTEGKVDFPKAEKAISNKVTELIKTGFVITQGFVGSTPEGFVATLGREGSDYTASIFGAALKATAIEIWTDVDGIMTTDPRQVKQAFPVPEMTYEEAMELSHFGAKVIFPATMRPAMTSKIPIWVKNTFNPTFRGTLITNKSSDTTHIVKGISSLNHICLLNVEGSGMVGVAGVSGRLFTAISREKINVILISQASSEHSICIAVNEVEAEKAKRIIEEEFQYEIKTGQIDEVVMQRSLCIVAIVGENMKHLPGTASKMFAALGKNGVNIIAIAQGSSEKNISAVIASKDQTKALNTLHEAFFLSDKKVLNLFLLGPGLVGGKVLDIIEKQRNHLSEKHLLDVRVIGISNSRKMYFDENKIKDWKKKLSDKGDAASIESFVAKMKQINLPNSVFIDATASDNPIPFYEQILASNISIVTPNKRACSGKLPYYQKLKHLSVRHNSKFLFETNVGAGLPVINTLNDLLMSGDEVLKIEAVVSGTLNYLFYHFDEGMSFAELLLKAKELGYTEPDPRDDLSGMDVARKILILARECGSTLELKDVTVENLVPANCRKAKTVVDFFTELKKTEKIFTDRLLKAKKKKCKLKYIATYENGKTTTALKEVNESHPFYSLAGTENSFCFTTQRYKQYPLVVKGPGAGAEVTAAGVFADVIKIANS